MSSPGIFDQNVVARPCRAGCRAHVHVQELVEDPGNNDLGGGRPSGWTAQGFAPEDNLMWFVCNVCEAMVSELEVEEHRCGA